VKIDRYKLRKLAETSQGSVSIDVNLLTAICDKLDKFEMVENLMERLMQRAAVLVHSPDLRRDVVETWRRIYPKKGFDDE
jgi:hypothetical protein